MFREILHHIVFLFYKLYSYLLSFILYANNFNNNLRDLNLDLYCILDPDSSLLFLEGTSPILYIFSAVRFFRSCVVIFDINSVLQILIPFNPTFPFNVKYQYLWFTVRTIFEKFVKIVSFKCKFFHYYYLVFISLIFYFQRGVESWDR